MVSCKVLCFHIWPSSFFQCFCESAYRVLDLSFIGRTIFPFLWKRRTISDLRLIEVSLNVWKSMERKRSLAELDVIISSVFSSSNWLRLFSSHPYWSNGSCQRLSKCRYMSFEDFCIWRIAVSRHDHSIAGIFQLASKISMVWLCWLQVSSDDPFVTTSSFTEFAVLPFTRISRFISSSWWVVSDVNGTFLTEPDRCNSWLILNSPLSKLF